MSRPEWQLPQGVSRSLWEFANDPRIARDEGAHLAESTLLEFDRQKLAEWFPTPGAIADLGCGTGRLAIDFARRGWTVVGVDLSRESLRVAQEQARMAGVSLSLMRANLCELNCLPSGYFDGALLMFGTLGMISGAENRAAALRHAHRILKPGGRLALHVHNVWRHLFVSEGRRWLMQDLFRRAIGHHSAGDTSRGYRGIPRMYHHSFTLPELRRVLLTTGFVSREIVPLAPECDRTHAAGAGDMNIECRGVLKTWRATGWLVCADRTP